MAGMQIIYMQEKMYVCLVLLESVRYLNRVVPKTNIERYSTD